MTSADGMPPEAVAARHLDMVTSALTPSERWTAFALDARAARSAGDGPREQRAFSELMEASTGWLLAKAIAQVGPDAGEDIVAETYIDLLRLIRTDKPIGNVKGALSVILQSNIRDELRRRTRRAAVTSVEEVQDELDLLIGEIGVEGRVIDLLVTNEVMSRLPAEDRQIIAARHLLGLSVEQTAARLGLTRDQVKKRSGRALVRLKEVMTSAGLL